MLPDRIKQIYNQAAVDPTPHGKIVYLDTKHWVGIRKAAELNVGPGAYVEVHKLLRELTGTRKISIPVTLPLLGEVRKQTEPTKSQTLALMYDLCGCYMVNPLDLNVLEFNSYPNRKYPKVWTLPTNMLREVVVSVVPKSTKHKDVAEKAQGLVDDFRSRISLRDFVETRLSHPAVESGEQKAFIDGQNVLIDRNRNNHSFPKLFEECRLAKAQQIVTRWKKEGRIPQDANIDFQREFCWPGCVIPAWLLAYVACDVSGERMRKGDDVDFIHARLALPYCDYFFTDRRMKHLLSVKPPGAPSALKDLKSMCRATIMDDPNEILGTLRPLV